MVAPEERFACHRDVTGTWTVWDRAHQCPAKLGGCVLSGREEARARAACAILARIYRNRLDFASVERSRRTMHLP